MSDAQQPVRSTPLVRRISIRLSVQDWSDLTHFLKGDLHNMEESKIKRQMRRIVETIDIAVSRSPNSGMNDSDRP